jgi:hypothetical protein
MFHKTAYVKIQRNPVQLDQLVDELIEEIRRWQEMESAPSLRAITTTPLGGNHFFVTVIAE